MKVCMTNATTTRGINQESGIPTDYETTDEPVAIPFQLTKQKTQRHKPRNKSFNKKTANRKQT
jgi:hypothetical protein